jgi:hypothetical protein
MCKLSAFAVSALLLCSAALAPALSHAQSATKYFKFWESGMGMETFGTTDSTRSFSTSRSLFAYQYSLNVPLFHLTETSNVSISPGIGVMFGHPIPTSNDKLSVGVNIPAFLTYRNGTDASYYNNTKYGFAAGAGIQYTMLASYEPTISMMQPSIMLEGSATISKKLVKLRFTYGIAPVDAGGSRIDSRFGLYFVVVPRF